jgi:hypothetical protein
MENYAPVPFSNDAHSYHNSTSTVTPLSSVEKNKRRKIDSKNRGKGLNSGDYSSGMRQTTMTQNFQYERITETSIASVSNMSSPHLTAVVDTNKQDPAAAGKNEPPTYSQDGDYYHHRDDSSVDLCMMSTEVEKKKRSKKVDLIRITGVPSFESTQEKKAPRSSSRSGFDLRGWRGEFDDSPLPQGFCVHCRCPEDLCHNTVFGHYCELRSFLFLGDGRRDLVKTTTEEFEEDQNQAYNQYLNVKTFEALGILDGYNEYSPPSCLKDGSMARMFNMFLFKRYEQLGRGSFLHHA